MKITVDLTKEEIWSSWDEIIKFMTENTALDYYPEGSVIMIKQVLEDVLREEAKEAE